MNDQNYYKREIEKLTGAPISDSDGIDSSYTIGPQFPKSLNEYYKINSEHNRLYKPNKIYEIDDYLIIAEKNQNVVIWGIKSRDITEDPIVYQGQQFAEATQCYSEELTFSKFIISMWKWQKKISKEDTR